jgi:hypothetical protein
VSSLHSSYVWLPPLMAGLTPLLAVIMRCSTLLIGLLVTLSKSAPGDRVSIFVEFARAMGGRRPIRRRD